MKFDPKFLIGGVILFFAVALFNMAVTKVQERALVDKVTQNVLMKLQRDYVPGPYAPGFDPDKVNPRTFQKN